MRRLYPLLAVCMAAISATSCLTAPAARPLTVELFGLSAASVPSSPARNSSYVMADPSLPDSTAATAALEASPSPSAAPTLAAPTFWLPDAPETQMRADLGFMTPPSPRLRTAYALAVPDAPVATPAVAASKPAVTATAPKAAAAALTKPSTAPVSAAPAAQPRAAAPQSIVAASGSVAAVSSSTATSSTAASAPAPAASYGTLREIFARVGDQLQIGLDGTGFLFLGFPDSSPQGDGMSFKTKENRSGKTWFSFQALKLGIYDLDFLQQDNTTGKSVKETVRVHVVNDQDFSSATSSQSTAVPASAEAGDTTYAETLTGLGQYQQAVSELMKGYADGNPGLNDQIASLYMRMNSYDAAAKFYAKNLSPQSPFTSRAVNGLMRVAAFQKDQQALMANLRQFLALKDAGTEETFMLAARMERDAGQIGVGLERLATYASRYPNGTFRDEADYIAAQMLEADSAFRNFTQARELYQDILTSFPESQFAASARDRILYIDRHFFQVR